MRMMSAVLVQAQRPQTILGLPARLFALVLAAPLPLVSLAIVNGAGPVAMMLWGLCSVLAWGMAWRRARNDHHYDRLLFFAPKFWKSISGATTRTLIAGPGETR